MALSVFFLLNGTLAAEISLLGSTEAGYVGSALFLVSAMMLVRLWWIGYPEPVRATVERSERPDRVMSPRAV